MNRFKNYLLNKSNQYRYYKSEYMRLKQDIIRLQNSLKDLNIKIDEKTSINTQLEQDMVKLQKEVDLLSYNLGGITPGHFYSPINDHDFLKSREDKIWIRDVVDGVVLNEEIPELIEGIELNIEEQIDLFKSFTQYYPEIPFKWTKEPGLRYYFQNYYYEQVDGTILYSLMRKLNPKRIIEVGSGFSSALMMDVNNLFFDNSIKLTFIEPYPDRLYSLMSQTDLECNTVIPEIVQDVDLELFKELEPNDILFIDSSHVVKTGSDVQHILFKILPILKSGVYVHFHDIYYPYEYPKDWMINKRWSWNEEYFIRAFLMYNNQFKVILSNLYLYTYDKKIFDDLRQYVKIPYGGAAIWLKKM